MAYGKDKAHIEVTEARPDEHCWVNEDCIAGHHMDEIECRFPSWTDDAAAPCPTCSHSDQPKPVARPAHPSTMIGRP